MMKFIVAFVLIVLSFGCDNDNSKEKNSDSTIIGKWKLVGGFISAGGPQYWVEIENGEEITFLENGNFVSSFYPDCSTGSFTADGSELILKYDCDGFTTGFENEEGAITFTMTFASTNLVLSPTRVFCIEGCSNHYKRI